MREGVAQLCVQFGGLAWCVRWGVFDHARFLCGAPAAKVPGRLVDTLLHRLAVERCGWGCGVGAAVGKCTPSPSGIVECASFTPARRLGPCLCAWLGQKRLLKAPGRSLWWVIVDCARPQAAQCELPCAVPICPFTPPRVTPLTFTATQSPDTCRDFCDIS